MTNSEKRVTHEDLQKRITELRNLRKRRETVIPEPQTIDFSNNPEAIASAEEQHKIVDNGRSTEGIDYLQLKQEADNLVTLRINLEREGRLSDYNSVGGTMYPDFCRKFPKFFENIKTVEFSRLNEVIEIMHMILDKLNRVKNGEMTHTEMRTQVFEKDLAERFVKSKR